MPNKIKVNLITIFFTICFILIFVAKRKKVLIKPQMNEHINCVKRDRQLPTIYSLTSTHYVKLARPT